MTYSYLNIQKQKNKQILNYIKHEKSTITSKRDTHSSYWTGDIYICVKHSYFLRRKRENEKNSWKIKIWP